MPSILAVNSVATGLGNGDGTFQALVRTMTTKAPYGLAIADINGDQRPDALSLQQKDLVVQLGSGDGKFLAEQRTTYAAIDSRMGSALTMADLDGDGMLDAIALNPIEQNLSVLFGQPGGWSVPIPVALTAVPFMAVVSDYNQDGVLDFAVGLTRTAAKIELLQQGMGDRQFAKFPALTMPSNFRLAAQGDVNGDGVADIVAMDAGGLNNNVNVYLGTGGAHFVLGTVLSVPAGAAVATTGDWDGDGHPDLATVSSMGDSICVLRTTVK